MQIQSITGNKNMQIQSITGNFNIQIQPIMVILNKWMNTSDSGQMNTTLLDNFFYIQIELITMELHTIFKPS